MKRLSGSIFFLLIIFIFQSCGSTHQFIPPRRLAKSDYEINFSLVYDLNHINFLPEYAINAYKGVGDDYFLGIGYIYPLTLTHFTAAKYTSVGSGHDGYYYASLHGIFLAMNMMPGIEVGASYVKNRHPSYHSFTAGLDIYLDDMPVPIWVYFLMPFVGDSSGQCLIYRSIPTVSPFIKYQYTHNDFRFSLQNHLGLSEKLVMMERVGIIREDTMVIKNEDIERIDIGDSPNYFNTKIWVGQDKFYDLAYTDPYPDRWFPVMTIWRLNRFPANEKTRYYYLNKYDDEGHEPVGIYELDVEVMLKSYKDGSDLLFINTDKNDEIVKRKIKWYLHDWSVGLATRLDMKYH